MREQIRDRTIRIDSERALIVTESFRRNENVLPIIKRPLALYDVCSQMTIRVEDDEIIVGNTAKHFCGSCILAEWIGESWIPDMVDSGQWALNDDGLYHSPPEQVAFSVAPEDAESLKGIREYWKTRLTTAVADAWKPDGYEDFAKLGASSYTFTAPMMQVPVGHLTPGHEKIIRVGYGAIRKQAQDWMDEHKGNLMGEDVNRFLFYKSTVIACQAAILLIERYGRACYEKAGLCGDEPRRAELMRMGDSLMWIATMPARTFWEACQAAILYQVLLKLEAGYPALAMGRFDQYTWPYLKADLEDGRLTTDQAQEIVDAVFLKLNCFYAARPPDITVRTGVGVTYQHITIGGADRETGEDATNDVTYMVLESISRLRLHDPTISLRINDNTPDMLWECALETTRLIGGLPLFQNDEVIIPALMKELDFELKDARDYSIIGCQEIVGSGNDYPAPNGIHPPHATVYFGSIFLMAINNGINPANGQQCELKTGFLYEMNDIEEVKSAIRDMCRYIIKWHVSVSNYTEHISMYQVPHAPLSISIEGCMESGKDCTAGGAKYNSYGGTATGLATLADSLSTIEYMCFDKKLCTTRELYDAVMADWEGSEPLRRQILEEVPHFGNGDPYADRFMKWICDTYYDICRECYSTRSSVFKAGLYGATDHIYQGMVTWATPDGRKNGDPLADACSPAQGRDRNGPTSIFRSEACFDHRKFMDGIAINVRIHPSAVNDDESIMKLRDMTKEYFANGGLETQYNVVSTESLRAAQEDPDAHRDLVVRIAGFSAYFIELGREGQDDIISRSENYF